MQTIALVDYGSGNLHSAAKALERAARDVTPSRQIVVTDRADVVMAADRIVLPGVGAFADCMSGLCALPGMIDALDRQVRHRGRPFLGICVGMQLLATRGLEFAATDGLDWIPGVVRPLTPNDQRLKIPHMGWNTLSIRNPHPLLHDTPTDPNTQHAYFVHSFHVEPADPTTVVAVADYGGPVTAMIGQDNMAGVQFHPEKSQALGLALLSRFLTWQP